MDDDDIRAALRRGDSNVAFRLLVQKHGPAIYSRCCRILRARGPAEDAMQQTMIAAFRSRGRLLEVEQLRGWLIQIATRKSLDALRSSKRAERLYRDLLHTDAPNGDDLLTQLGSTQDRRALEQCLGSLDPELLSAVLMRYLDGMPWDRIADVMELPLDTIRMRVQRGALKSLRDCLASKEGKP